MSKVLKVFVNLILLLFILTGVALLVPPLIGITTVVAEEEMVTNMQTGSVAYALKKPIGELQSGDKILETSQDSAYIYEIVKLDVEAGTAEVRLAEGGTEKELELRSTAQKMVITVPLIGYVSIAMQTMEGRIILGLAALLIIVLFIVVEVWCKRRDDEEDEEYGEDGEEEELTAKELKARRKEQKRQAKEKKKREKRGEGEEDEFFKELADKKRSSDARSEEEYRIKQEDARRLGENMDEELLELSLDDAEVFIKKAEEQPDDAVKDPGEEAVSFADEAPEDEDIPKEALKKNVETDTIPDVQAALEAVLETQQIPQHEQFVEENDAPEEEQPLMADEIELAMPVKTVEELLQEAYSNGDDPVVREEETTGVTFVDYSECL